METKYDDDYLKKVFRDKLKDFEPEDTDIEWRPVFVPMLSDSKIGRKIAPIASLIFLLFITSTPVVLDNPGKSAVIKSYVKDSLLEQKELLCRQLEPNNGGGNSDLMPTNHSFAISIIKDDKTNSSTIQYPDLDEIAKSQPIVATIFPMDAQIIAKIQPIASISFSQRDSAAIEPVLLDSILTTAATDSTRTIDSLLTKEKPKLTDLFTLSAGLFVNSNRFAPTRGDGNLIQSFNQNKNIVKNRVGAEIMVSMRALKLSFIKVQPTLKYMFLHKSYTFQKQSIQSETADEFVTITESHGYHFVGLGLKLMPQSPFGRQLQLESVFLKSLGSSGYSFAHSNLELGVSTIVHIQGKGAKVFTIEPVVKYTLPLSGLGLFSTNMINVGFRATLFGDSIKSR